MSNQKPYGTDPRSFANDTPLNEDSVDVNAPGGNGLKYRTIKIGRGYSIEEVKAPPSNANNDKLMLSDKYYIKKSDLDNGVLNVRYLKNNHLTSFKNHVVGGKLKKIVNDSISVGKLDLDEYKKLKAQEKDIINRFLGMINKGHLLDSDESNELQEEFETLWGEFSAGNDNELIKKKLKIYIRYAIKIGKIPKATGLAMIEELNM